MKRTNLLQHLNLENTYVKYRYNELLASHTKLQTEISDLNRKLDQLYKNHANTIILLQEKNHHFSQIIDEKSQHIRNIMDHKQSIRDLLFDDEESGLTFSSSADNPRRGLYKDDLGFEGNTLMAKPSTCFLDPLSRIPKGNPTTDELPVGFSKPSN